MLRFDTPYPQKSQLDKFEEIVDSCQRIKDIDDLLKLLDASIENKELFEYIQNCLETWRKNIYPRPVGANPQSFFVCRSKVVPSYEINLLVTFLENFDVDYFNTNKQKFLTVFLVIIYSEILSDSIKEQGKEWARIFLDTFDFEPNSSFHTNGGVKGIKRKIRLYKCNQALAGSEQKEIEVFSKLIEKLN